MISTLILSVASVSSKVCWPTTFLSVVRTIWLIASLMFSIAMTGLVASTTRYYERAETSTLTLSRIVMPWNLNRHRHYTNETFRSTLANGTMTASSRALLADHVSEAESNALFVLLHDVNSEREENNSEYHRDDSSCYQSSHLCSPLRNGRPGVSGRGRAGNGGSELA